MKKTFEKCLWEELEQVFGLEKTKNLTALSDWLASETPIDGQTAENLAKLNRFLIDNFWNWNEDELKMQFISPLLYLVDYQESDKYQPFSQRPMRMRADGIELYGVAEWLLAAGRQIPRAPFFFFLHEYKKEQGTSADPLGQLMAAMLTAQHHNKDKEMVLYGTYIVGKDWYFTVLQGKKYQTTLAYNATEADKLNKIFSILKNIKTLII